MPTPAEIDTFLKEIFSIAPRYIDVFGGNVPGMMGTAVATQGALTSAGDVVNQLREDTISLTQVQKSNDTEKVAGLTNKIEGHLLLLQTLSVIDSKRCESLIQDLDKISHG